jgi:hypothetical protein
MQRAVIFEKGDKALKNQFHFDSSCGVSALLDMALTDEYYGD